MSKVFGEILSSLRREKGYSQREASADLGISQALLSHYENSAREPKLEFIAKVCDYYDVSVDYILGRDKEKKPRVIPSPQDCENSPTFLLAIDDVFEFLVETGDPELFADVIDYLTVFIDNITHILREPLSPYEPSREVKLRLAEEQYIDRIKKINLTA